MNSIYSSRPATTATPRSWTATATSAVLHTAVVLVIVLVGRAADVLPAMTSQSLTFVRVAPPPPAPAPIRLPAIVREAVKHEPLSVPEIEKPPVPEPIIARVEPPRPAPEPVVVDRPKPAPPVVQVGSFASAANAEVVRPSREIQKAGFDAADARVAGPSIASAVVGTFEQSAGWQQPGSGRPVAVAEAGFGSGMAAGLAGRGDPKGVADAGFGAGVAGPAGRGGSGRVVASAGLDAATGGGGGPRAPQAVKATDFDARAEQTSAPKAARQAPIEVPVEILSKPTPAYTDEARALRIEGEVALEVEFAATGEIRVLKVVRGLGHGLDECAAKAVQGMRFKPATRHGQAIDFRTTVNIVFRLA